MLISNADANSYSHPGQYAALGFRVACLPPLAEVAIAAVEDAADLANADRTSGILSDGFVAAPDGARQWAGATSRVVRGGTPVCLAGAFPWPSTARRGQKETGGDTRPGSAGPLVRNVTVFTLQYGVAVAAAMKLEPRVAVAIIGHAVSGASAGYFCGAPAPLQHFRRKYRRQQNASSALIRIKF